MSEEKKEAPLDFEKEFVLDKNKTAGVWVPYKTAKLLIASTQSRPFINARDLLFSRYPKKESLESEEVQIKYEAIIAQYILLGWENFTVPYSLETAKRYLRNDGFRTWVMGIANSSDHFKSQEDDLKN